MKAHEIRTIVVLIRWRITENRNIFKTKKEILSNSEHKNKNKAEGNYEKIWRNMEETQNSAGKTHPHWRFLVIVL
ncbi:MAG: hypothetical protein COA45_01335 [Zetaproteobacteria bacterium]|nr:MAG: hypothetical protein COA45_01335 [Zetaproteobacteria bacterium]